MIDLRQLNDHDLLIHIAGKVEELVGNGQPGRCAINDQRLRRLETWRAWITGATVVIGFMAGTFGTMVVKLWDR